MSNSAHNERRHYDSDILSAIGRLQGTTEALHETVENLNYRLYGNGQPGDIAKIEDRLGIVEHTQTKAAAWLAGAVAVLASIGAGFEFLFHLFWKKA